MKFSSLPPRYKALIFFSCGVAAALLGLLIYGHGSCQRWQYLNQDYACRHGHEIEKTPYYKLEVALTDYFEDQKRIGAISRASLYFRDLHHGPVMGIDEDEAYTPASLLKLPLVMTYFSYAQEHPEILDVELRYSASEIRIPMATAIERAAIPLKEGSSYTVKELMRAAVVYSDNLSYYLLVEYFNGHVPDGSREILRVFQELGVVDPRSPLDEVVTARNYSSLLRLLYNASYLNEEHSELLLSWLVESTYVQGLQAGLPAGTHVANKFGERLNPDGSKELFDCGIIYYSGNPYSLCVMTQGADWKVLQKVIATISSMIYKEVDGRRI